MAPHRLEAEAHARDANFAKALHGKTAKGNNSLMAMLSKDNKAQGVSIENYFKHWDEMQAAKDETPEDREARRNQYASLTREYYNISTDLYENGWAQSFHFCRFHYGEAFLAALARHEHYLAHVMNIKDNMTVLDVGCGVGGPARQIVKFTGANIVGLNNNDYQIERATNYAAKEGLSHKLQFVKGDFMVCASSLTYRNKC